MKLKEEEEKKKLRKSKYFDIKAPVQRNTKEGKTPKMPFYLDSKQDQAKKVEKMEVLRSSESISGAMSPKSLREAKSPKSFRDAKSPKSPKSPSELKPPRGKSKIKSPTRLDGDKKKKYIESATVTKKVVLLKSNQK